jgi:hypothetical protein
MHGITTCLPKRASMHDNVGFVMNAPRGIFLDTRELAGRSWRPLGSRLGGNLLKLVELVLQSLDLF